MFDLGIHLIDLLLWLFGDLEVTRYGDDALGGVESNAQVEMCLASSTTGNIRISRTCERPNKLKIIGSQGWAQADIYQADHLLVKMNNSRPVLQRSKSPQTFVRALADQLADFLDAIEQKRTPLTTVDDAVRSISVIERCYNQTRALPLPEEAPLPGEIRWA